MEIFHYQSRLTVVQLAAATTPEIADFEPNVIYFPTVPIYNSHLHERPAAPLILCIMNRPRSNLKSQICNKRAGGEMAKLGRAKVWNNRNNTHAVYKYLMYSFSVLVLNCESGKHWLLRDPWKFLVSNLLFLVSHETNRTWPGWNWLRVVRGRFHLAVSGGNAAQGGADDQYYQGVSSNGINHIWRLSNRKEEMRCAPLWWGSDGNHSGHKWGCARHFLGHLSGTELDFLDRVHQSEITKIAPLPAGKKVAGLNVLDEFCFKLKYTWDFNLTCLWVWGVLVVLYNKTKESTQLWNASLMPCKGTPKDFDYCL